MLKTQVIGVLLMLASPFGSLHAQPPQHPLTAAEFEKTIPDKAVYQTAKSVQGKTAVSELRDRMGVGPAGVSRFGVNDPLQSQSSSEVEATFLHSEVTSRSKALASADMVKPQVAVGDTITETWTEDGWRYTATRTWDGGAWQLTSFSATKISTLPQ